tara:strand:+ start:476 stop:613 length:138 start_codon:yes stop_codon:yes gene_type:complete
MPCGGEEKIMREDGIEIMNYAFLVGSEVRVCAAPLLRFLDLVETP